MRGELSEATAGDSRRGRACPADLWVMLAGLACAVIALVGATVTVGQLGELPATVRVATAAEAPNPDYVDGTVVAEPDRGPSLAPRLKGTMAWLALFALLAGLGLAAIAWGGFGYVSAARSAGRRTAREERGDGPEETG